MAIDDNELKQAINNSSEQLLQLSKDIKNVSFPQPETVILDTNKLNDVYICDLIKNVPAGYSKDFKETNFIYIFSIDPSGEDAKKQIYSALYESRKIQNYQKFEGKKDFCKPNNSDSNYLYIGRSQKLRSRLKQHLGAGSEGVFAMHMLRWVAGISVKLHIHYYQFNKLDNLIIQSLEDGLWECFQPMFGKKGGK